MQLLQPAKLKNHIQSKAASIHGLSQRAFQETCVLCNHHSSEQKKIGVKIKSNFTMEKPDKCYLSQMIKVNIHSKSHGDSTLDMLKQKWHFMVFLLKPRNSRLITRKTSANLS